MLAGMARLAVFTVTHAVCSVTLVVYLARKGGVGSIPMSPAAARRRLCLCDSLFHIWGTGRITQRHKTKADVPGRKFERRTLWLERCCWRSQYFDLYLMAFLWFTTVNGFHISPSTPDSIGARAMLGLSSNNAAWIKALYYFYVVSHINPFA